MSIVQRRELNWLELTERAHGKDWTELDDAYQFTGRTFKQPNQAFSFVETAAPTSASVYADNYADNYA